jgi:hypothetical protein
MAILTSKLCKPVISYLYREMYNDTAHTRGADRLWHGGAPETASSCHFEFSSRQVSAAAAGAATAATASIPDGNIKSVQGMHRIVELEKELAQSRQEEKRMKKEVAELERRIKALCASHTA